MLAVLVFGAMAMAGEPATQPTTRPAIPAAAVEFEGHHYLVVPYKERKTLPDAMADAEKRGGRLFVADSAKEAEFAHSLIARPHRSIWVAVKYDEAKKCYVDVYTGKKSNISVNNPQGWAPSWAPLVGYSSGTKQCGMGHTTGRLEYIIEWDY
jgi:hypothetical protein